MYLLIDSSLRDQIALALFDKENIDKKTYHEPNRAVLASIDAFLSEKGFKPEDIAGILAVVGAGGFSSTRVAVTVANTFGFVFQIPLLAIGQEEAAHPQACIDTLLQQKPGNYIAPEYSAEPNITQSKKVKK